GEVRRRLGRADRGGPRGRPGDRADRRRRRRRRGPPPRQRPARAHGPRGGARRAPDGEEPAGAGHHRPRRVPAARGVARPHGLLLATPPDACRPHRWRPGAPTDARGRRWDARGMTSSPLHGVVMPSSVITVSEAPPVSPPTSSDVIVQGIGLTRRYGAADAPVDAL